MSLLQGRKQLLERKYFVVNGPFMCGSSPNVHIFYDDLTKRLLDGKYALCKRVYNGSKYITPNKVEQEDQNFHKQLGSQHETVNHRLKIYCFETHFQTHSVKTRFLFACRCPEKAISLEDSDPLQ